MRAPASIFRPTPEDITENERAWIGFLRLLSQDSDPSPTLSAIQALRQALYIAKGQCRKR